MTNEATKNPNFEITADYIKLPLVTKYRFRAPFLLQQTPVEADTLEDLLKDVCANDKLCHLLYEYNNAAKYLQMNSFALDIRFIVEKIVFCDDLLDENYTSGYSCNYNNLPNVLSTKFVLSTQSYFQPFVELLKTDIFLDRIAAIEELARLNLELEEKKEKDRLKAIAENNWQMWQLLEKKRLAGDFADFESGNYNSTEITQSIY